MGHTQPCAQFAVGLAVGVKEDDDAVGFVEAFKYDLFYCVRPFVFGPEDGVVEGVVLADVLVFPYGSGCSLFNGTDFSRKIATCAR